jgi:hypothetical protein
MEDFTLELEQATVDTVYYELHPRSGEGALPCDVGTVNGTTVCYILFVAFAHNKARVGVRQM